jgi:hypothetical protein
MPLVEPQKSAAREHATMELWTPKRATKLEAGVIRMFVPLSRAFGQLPLLLTRFLQKQALPHFDSGREWLDTIAGMLKELPSTERVHVSSRIETLRPWANRAERLLPLLMKTIEPGRNLDPTRLRVAFILP